MGATGVTGVILREHRAARRARLKVLALIALILARGVLEMVINNLPACEPCPCGDSCGHEGDGVAASGLTASHG